MSAPKGFQVFSLVLKDDVHTTIEVTGKRGTYILRADGHNVGSIQRVGDEQRKCWHLTIRGIYWRRGQQNLFGGASSLSFRTHAEAVAKAVSILKGVYES